MTETFAPILGEATIQELREAVQGEVIARADEGYAEACKIWNGAHDDRRPALIVRPSGTADVVAAVGFARSNDLAIAVRGGAHSVAGFSTVDDGVVIDFSSMRGVRVDPEGRKAYVEAGATWADVDAATQEHGLATTGGLVSNTGVAGFTLGGGIGWLMRCCGLACDNMAAAELVTADGNVVRADEDENPELLWGLRGGGGNFGVVTEFELTLHPVGPMVYAGPIFYPAEAAVPLMRLFREWAPNAPEEITAVVNLTTAPPLPVIPEEWHGKKVVAFIAMSVGDIDETAALVADFRTVADPIADLLGPIPYTVMQSLLDPLWQKGIHAYFKATNLRELSDDLIASLAKLHLEAPGPQCEVHLHQMGGAVARAEESAFGDRSMPFLVNAVTGWHDPSVGDAHRQWARDIVEAAASASTGHAYVNFLSEAGGAKGAYEDGVYARLVALKDEYDPENVFQLNQNVEPSKAA